MNDKLQDKLNKDFPTLFTKSDFKKGIYGTRHCECDDGWHDIIRGVCETLVKLNIPELRFEQIKEKFGSIRMYVNIYSKVVEAIVDQATIESLKTCEYCGAKEGVETNSGGTYWIRSLCPTCRGKEDEKRIERMGRK